MKRIVLWSVSTLLLMLLAVPAQSAKAASVLAPIGGLELTAITAGICTTCDSEPVEDPKPPKPPRLDRYIWEITGSKAGTASQVGYSLLSDYNNAGSTTMTTSFTFNDECRRVLTSGGVGISAALNLSVGTVYHCARQERVEFAIPPRTRLKVYKGDMRQFITYTAREYALYSDGSSTPTGRTDQGTEENRYSRISAVTSSL